MKAPYGEDIMKIGVVILNYNDYKGTIKCANRIIPYSSIDYIVIVDNGSSNEAFDEISNFANSLESGKLKIIKSNINGGYAKGNNIGVHYLLDKTDSDIIGIVNPDISFDDYLGEQVKEQFYIHPNFAILTGLQTDKKGNISKRAFWRQLNIPQFIIGMSPSLSKLQDLIFGNYVTKRIKESDNKIIEVPIVEGCLFFIRANVFREVHGFDESTFLFMEEDILSAKIRKMGWKIGVIKDIRFVHDHSATIGKFISYFNRVKIMNRSKKYYFCECLLEGRKGGSIFYFCLEIISWIEQIIVMLPYLFFKGKFLNR